VLLTSQCVGVPQERIRDRVETTARDGGVRLALGGAVLLAGATPAGACECAESRPPESVAFTGTAVEMVESGIPPAWRFRTDVVLRGAVGTDPVVQIATPVEYADGSIGESDCDIQHKALEPGRRYRVGAVGDVAGTGQLSVNRCGGSLSLLSDAPPTSDLPATSGGRALPVIPAIAVVGTLTVGAVIVVALRQRRGKFEAG